MTNVIKNSIPNTVTCLNLFSGCIACVMAFEAKYELALLFIALSSIFDFFDGLLDRMLNAHSIIGKDLDSLADDVSFGVAPSLIVFSLFKEMYYPASMEFIAPYLPYLAFLISVFSALPPVFHTRRREDGRSGARSHPAECPLSYAGEGNSILPFHPFP